MYDTSTVCQIIFGQTKKELILVGISTEFEQQTTSENDKYNNSIQIYIDIEIYMNPISLTLKNKKKVV